VSDERLRRRGRAATAGDAAARAGLLHERLRSGGLSPARLDLLARLGHEPARLVLGAEAPPRAPLEALDPTAWGPTAGVVAAAAAGRAVLAAYEALGPACATCGSYGQVQVPFAETYEWRPCPDCATCATCGGGRSPGAGADRACPDCADLRPRRAVEAAEAWLACPCPEHAAAAAEAARLGDVTHLSDRFDHAMATAEGARAASDADDPALGAWCARAIHHARRAVGAAPVEAAVRAALEGWALVGE